MKARVAGSGGWADTVPDGWADLAPGGWVDAGPGGWADEVRDVRDVVGGRRGLSARVLLGYARGFVEAAMGRGWMPVPGRATDWESLRLAAVCQLLTQSQAAPLI
jgi:Family of unknown function (DUF6401)